MEMPHMDEFIKLLDPGLDYISHEIIGDTLFIRVASNKGEAVCLYCGHVSSKRHSTYERSFQDLPVMGMKSRIIIENRKMFCTNPECSHKTFAETFGFISPKARKSSRRLEKIINVSLNVNSVNAADMLKDGIADVGKSTICNLLKKRDTPSR